MTQQKKVWRHQKFFDLPCFFKYLERKVDAVSQVIEQKINFVSQKKVFFGDLSIFAVAHKGQRRVLLKGKLLRKAVKGIF